MPVNSKNSKRMYRSMLHDIPNQFLGVLSDNIMQGPLCQLHALLQLDILVASNRTDLLENFRINDDENLLQVAAIFYGDVEVMCRLATACPRLLQVQRQGDYQGQNVLHTLVSKKNVAAAAAILQHPNLKEPWLLLNAKAVGPRFYGTVMMGELPLSVAALTFNLDMVDLLLSKGAKLHAVNSLGDTVFHSLVRFTALYPAKEKDAEKMMMELHERLKSPSAAPSPQVEPMSVWLMENNDGLTVLRLTATYTQPLLFKYVLTLEGVYSQLDRHDGLFDSLLYDITEIDPVARRQWRLTNSSTRRRHGKGPVNVKDISSFNQLQPFEVGCCAETDTPLLSIRSTSKLKASPSVLEIICETGRVDKAFEVLNTFVVRSVVRSKWHHYRLWFIAWAAFHIVFMIMLTTYAIYKARIISATKEEVQSLQTATSSPGNTTTALSSTTISLSMQPAVSSTTEMFVQVMAVLTLLPAVLIIVCEARRLWHKQPLHLWLIHHNGLYRLEMVAFAFSLIADSIWYWVKGPDNNFFLILALLIGWWFTSFFLRPFKKFSFFTVMLQKVLLGDMFRFSTIILLELLAFSAAMYITFLTTPGPLPDGFQHLGFTIMTMFRLMLGMTDVEVLYEAAHPWLAITLYILFVLLTYVLVLNALIAMMSNTCSLISEHKGSQWELQRLSVVLLLESVLPYDCLMYNSGQPMFVARFDIQTKQMIQEVRYFAKVTSVQTDYSDGAAILKRKSKIQTQRFDEIHAVMSTGGNMAHLDLLATFTYQHAHLSSLNEDNKETMIALGSSKDDYAHHLLLKKPYTDTEEGASRIKKKEQSEEERQKVEREAENAIPDFSNKNYSSVRQTLLQSLTAQQLAENMTGLQLRKKKRKASSQDTNQTCPMEISTKHVELDQSIKDNDVCVTGKIHPSPFKKPFKMTKTNQDISSKPFFSRRRHKSEQIQRKKTASFESLNELKSLEILPSMKEEYENVALQNQDRSEEHMLSLPAQMSEEHTPSTKHQLIKVQPRLPTPDVFTISHKPLPNSNS